MDKIEFLIEKAELTAELLDIAIELDARESSFNCVMSKFDGISWKDLCSRGIELLTRLKG